MGGVQIRTAVASDRAELLQVFGRAGEGSPTGSLWGHAASEADVYLLPYLDLEPESLFVAVVDGALGGYLAGSLGDRLPDEATRLERAIRTHRLVLRRRPAAFFLRSVLDVAGSAVRGVPSAGELCDPRWPAHLHINLLPEARGTGAAAWLMDGWFARLRAAGSPGCYLQTLVENARAVRFFERMGFERHGPTPPVPGLRGPGRLRQQTMVRSV